MRTDSYRIAVAGIAGLAALAALILVLFDWARGSALLAALAVSWALLVGFGVGVAAYRRHRGVVLGAVGAVVLALLVVLRPEGSPRAEATPPLFISGYGAEVWPNQLASQGAFILRERLEGVDEAAAVGADGRASLDPVSTGPLMRELRFVPGGSTGAHSLELIDGGEAVVVVNPIDDAEVHHARGGSISRVVLPIGPVVRVEMAGLPPEARIAYLVGAGRALSPVASLVTPLRRMPLPVALLLFVVLGMVAAHAWADRVVTPLQRRFDVPKPGQPDARNERVPLVPRLK